MKLVPFMTTQGKWAYVNAERVDAIVEDDDCTLIFVGGSEEPIGLAHPVKKVQEKLAWGV